MTDAALSIQTFLTAPLETNTYLLRCGQECWVVDPGMGLETLVASSSRQGLIPSRILLTHAHGDHIAGAGELKLAFPAARLCCPAGEEELLTDPQKNLSAPFGFSIAAGPAEEVLRPGQTLTPGRAPLGGSGYLRAFSRRRELLLRPRRGRAHR